MIERDDFGGPANSTVLTGDVSADLVEAIMRTAIHNRVSEIRRAASSTGYSKERHKVLISEDSEYTDIGVRDTRRILEAGWRIVGVHTHDYGRSSAKREITSFSFERVTRPPKQELTDSEDIRNGKWRLIESVMKTAKEHSDR